MSNYTQEQVEVIACYCEASGQLYAQAAAKMLRAYAATLRQQPIEQGMMDCVSFSTVKKVVSALYRIGHTFPESQEEQAASFESLVLDLCRSVQSHFDELTTTQAVLAQNMKCDDLHIEESITRGDRPVATLMRDGSWRYDPKHNPFDLFGPNASKFSLDVYTHPRRGPVPDEWRNALQRGNGFCQQPARRT